MLKTKSQPLPVVTAEQIASHYKAAMDSVNTITELVSLADRTESDASSIERNKAHLRIMVAKPFWTTEDLSPLNAAISIDVPASTLQ